MILDIIALSLTTFISFTTGYAIGRHHGEEAEYRRLTNQRNR